MASEKFECNSLELGHAVSLACLLEASAPKPGNVHRGADFPDMTFYDFVVSAVALGNEVQTSVELPLGQLILRTITKTQQLVGTNTNLGMVLLMCPLAKSRWRLGTDCSRQELQSSLSEVLSELTPVDGKDVFQGIRKSKPGGMGQVDSNDVNHATDKGVDLIAAMELAKERDLIARQYCHGFSDVFEVACPMLLKALRQVHSLPDAIVMTYLKWIAEYPDTLVSRKAGVEVARELSLIARRVIESIGELDEYHRRIADLDFWLRADGKRRNPGTSADVMAAALLILLLTGELSSDKIQSGLAGARIVQREPGSEQNSD